MALPGANAAERAAPLSVSICDDENEWPPYSYFERVKGEKSTRLVGYSIDVIDEIFARHNIPYQIDMIPWTRCLAVVALGQRYQMVLNLSTNAKRGDHFLLSRTYYSTTAHYYYSRRQYPDGLRIASLADLKNYRICGIHSYNYLAYGLAPTDVDDGARDFAAMVAKLRRGRCALFLEQDEVMSGFAVLGMNFLADPDIGKVPVPGIAKGRFHFGISRKFPKAAALKKIIDDDLLMMEKSGRLREIWDRAVALPPQP